MKYMSIAKILIEISSIKETNENTTQSRMEPGSPNYVNQSDAFTTRPLNPSVHNVTLR